MLLFMLCVPKSLSENLRSWDAVQNSNKKLEDISFTNTVDELCEFRKKVEGHFKDLCHFLTWGQRCTD